MDTDGGEPPRRQENERENRLGKERRSKPQMDADGRRGEVTTEYTEYTERGGEASHRDVKTSPNGA
jgi:hypothetical protein